MDHSLTQVTQKTLPELMAFKHITSYPQNNRPAERTVKVAKC